MRQRASYTPATPFSGEASSSSSPGQHLRPYPRGWHPGSSSRERPASPISSGACPAPPARRGLAQSCPQQTLRGALPTKGWCRQVTGGAAKRATTVPRAAAGSPRPAAATHHLLLQEVKFRVQPSQGGGATAPGTRSRDGAGDRSRAAGGRGSRGVPRELLAAQRPRQALGHLAPQLLLHVTEVWRSAGVHGFPWRGLRARRRRRWHYPRPPGRRKGAEAR